jgi:hypothetical protein
VWEGSVVCRLSGVKVGLRARGVAWTTGESEACCCGPGAWQDALALAIHVVLMSEGFTPMAAEAQSDKGPKVRQSGIAMASCMIFVIAPGLSLT